MGDTLKLTKWWWSWSPEKLEEWLEEKEAQGWHLYNVIGQLRFHFVKSESRKIRYCIDYQNKITSDYKCIFMDAGWELVYTSSGWYIWRMEYAGERPDIYTEVDSLIDRNKKIITVLAIVGSAQLPSASLMIKNHLFHEGYHILPFVSLYTVLFSLLVYGIYRLFDSNKKLKLKR